MWRDAAGGVGYGPVPGRLTPALLRAHLRGEQTLGVYVVREDGRVRFAVLDVDAERRALEAAMGDIERLRRLRASVHDVTEALHRELSAIGLDPLRVDSGYKGRHLWLALDVPTPAARALALGRWAVARIGPMPPGVHVDVFPRQAEVPVGGLGNLVKLPLGVHLRSGRRAALIDGDHRPLADPWSRLRGLRGTPLPDVPAVDVASVITPEAPSPEPAAPAWTEVSFDRSPWVGPVLRGCGVLRAVVDEALTAGTIDPAAPVVLNHTLGHLPEGPAAVNYLYDRVGGVASGARMGAPHRGQPMGCPNIRSRMAAWISRGVPCACAFPARPGAHAHPLRHLDDLDPTAPVPPTLDDLLLQLAAQRARIRAIEAEGASLQRAVAAALRAVPDRSWSVPGGTWRLEEGPEGEEGVVFAAREGG